MRGICMKRRSARLVGEMSSIDHWPDNRVRVMHPRRSLRHGARRYSNRENQCGDARYHIGRMRVQRFPELFPWMRRHKAKTISNKR